MNLLDDDDHYVARSIRSFRVIMAIAAVIVAGASLYFTVSATVVKHYDYSKILSHIAIALAVLANVKL